MILDTIAASTKKRVEQAKRLVSAEQIQSMANSMPKGTFAFEAALKKKQISFICEIKKASPSKGIIAENFPYTEIAKEYEEAGADAISVLTEPEFFKGRNSYLKEISNTVQIPLLRKDFTIDPYQIYESKTIGASAVLLICALLDTATLQKYISICDTLGLSALVEAHDRMEIESAIAAGARIIGVNNRNLKTFEVDINNGIRLRGYVPDNIKFVAESGIRTREDIKILEQGNVDAVLIGETFMRSSDKRGTLNQLKGIQPV